ncbi:DUF6243 family protein [Streptomyces sp. URMC 126]|uniref:DUF6243 family protein n=1 Tax=Streptomyces sp. URMC 126 TaxID=3423401 RepID=UPI003F1A68E4
MTRGNGRLLGVGGTHSNLSRKALRGTSSGGPGRGTDPLAAKRELLRALREGRGGTTGA